MTTRKGLSLAALTSIAAIGLAALGGGCSATVRNGANGDGGAGGDNDSTGGSGGEGGGALPSCAIDCSKIDTPPCLTGACNPMTGQCEIVSSPKGAPCDDGLFCTVGDSCKDGMCKGGATNTCGMMGDACTDVECHEASKSCSLIPLPDGLTCTITDDLCIVNAECKAGLCKGVAKDCFFAPVPDQCHVGVCNSETGICEPQPGNDGAECPNDGDLCMVNKACSEGSCQGGQPKDCSAFSNGCNIGACDAATGDCYAVPIPPGGMCQEATDECNTGICDNNGTCNPVPNPGVQCASGTDACHLGTCDAAGKCQSAPANDGAVCDDGNMCTSGETCLTGACQGGVVGMYEVYFSETFASNAAGWTLGPEWQIGSATASAGFPVGNEDPGEDHTPSADNGIAGVVIGGYASTVSTHPMQYITSPAFDVSVAPGSVYLEFWRFLNSDYTPYMNNVVDVYDGTTWQNLWQSGGSPGIEDAAWTHESYDLTPYKNAAMQIRFGFDIQSSGVFTVSSWNLDDVVVANQVCN